MTISSKSYWVPCWTMSIFLMDPSSLCNGVFLVVVTWSLRFHHWLPACLNMAWPQSPSLGSATLQSSHECSGQWPNYLVFGLPKERMLGEEAVPLPLRDLPGVGCSNMEMNSASFSFLYIYIYYHNRCSSIFLSFFLFFSDVWTENMNHDFTSNFAFSICKIKKKKKWKFSSFSTVDRLHCHSAVQEKHGELNQN